mmetsp:Transcript_8534/g.12632  ORF Transcript_8534/g.12632 Transcript_8534/m.12632 type:complete len:98 (-) Transcript_8534:216-509(-)
MLWSVYILEPNSTTGQDKAPETLKKPSTATRETQRLSIKNNSKNPQIEVELEMNRQVFKPMLCRKGPKHRAETPIPTPIAQKTSPAWKSESPCMSVK